MTAFWLTYKPLSNTAPRGWPPEQMDALVRDFESDPSSATPLWRIASSRSASIGDRVYLFKQGSGKRGIFGQGELIEAPREQPDPTDIDAGLAPRARIRLTHLVNPADAFLLAYDEIADLVPKTLILAQQSGNRVPDEVDRALQEKISSSVNLPYPLNSADADDSGFDPASVDDDQERALRAIRVRRGQPGFRADLIEAYNGRCVVTGCRVEDVLEAAHIHPYSGKLSNHVSNGLLLRADIHTLFDCWLIGIDPTSRTVIVAESLKDSPYAKLAGRKLRSSSDPLKGASKKSLEWRYNVFSKMRPR